ncbi:MAG: tetratricopeptide repeat protein [Paracoccaceae bacterium]
MTAPLRRLLAGLGACLLAAACAGGQGDGGDAAPATLDHELAQAHRQLGLGFEAAGDIAAAVGEFETALALGRWPLAAATGGIAGSPWGDLARICDRREPAAQVVRACTRAISSVRFEPARLAALFANRADAYRRLGDADRAQADYQAALKVDSRNPRGLLARGRTKARAGRHAAALIDFDRAIAAGPDRPDAYLARALSRVALGDLEGAVADYDHILADAQALAAQPGAYRDRARVHCQLGQADAAAVDWQVWLAATRGGAAYVQEMLWARGYLRGAIADDFTPAAVASLRAWTRAGCPGG